MDERNNWPYWPAEEGGAEHEGQPVGGKGESGSKG